jgi:NADH:ubiquinone reductase (H+-translocating)
MGGTLNADAPSRERKRVVIVGGGLAGLAAAHALRRADADLVLIDRRNHHIFQPLLYQVATTILSPADRRVHDWQPRQLFAPDKECP